MTKNLIIHYDEEGDYFELILGKPDECYFEEVENGIFQRIDEKSGEFRGFAIAGFRKKTDKLKNIVIKLPLKNLLVSKQK